MPPSSWQKRMARAAKRLKCSFVTRMIATSPNGCTGSICIPTMRRDQPAFVDVCSRLAAANHWLFIGWASPTSKQNVLRWGAYREPQKMKYRAARAFTSFRNQLALRSRFETRCRAQSPPSSALACLRSSVSNPSVNQPYTGASSSRACCGLSGHARDARGSSRCGVPRLVTISDNTNSNATGLSFHKRRH